MIDFSKGFSIVRTFDASPEQVWNAWLDPECIAQWWHPAGASTPRDRIKADPRVGGEYQYTMVNEEDGSVVTTGGVYRELQPHTRLSFSWGEPGADPDDTPLVTIGLEPIPGGTRMLFELRGVAGQAGDGYFFDGWVATLDSLSAFLDRHETAKDSR